MKKTHAIECPQCGRISLIQRNENLYQCLACNFRKDFSFLDFGKLMIAFFAVILVAFLTKHAYEFGEVEPIQQSYQAAPKAN